MTWRTASRAWRRSSVKPERYSSTVVAFVLLGDLNYGWAGGGWLGSTQRRGRRPPGTCTTSCYARRSFQRPASPIASRGHESTFSPERGRPAREPPHFCQVQVLGRSRQVELGQV